MSSRASTPSGPPQKGPELLIEPMSRPLQADGTPVTGTRGRPIKLLLNTFKVRFEVDGGGKPMEQTDRDVMTQYTIVMNVDNDKRRRPPTDHETSPPVEATARPSDDDKLAPKSRYRAIWATLENSGVLGEGVKPAYDGRFVAYSVKPLELTTHLVKTELYGNFKVTIKDPIELRICELIKWFSNSKGASTIGDVMSCLAGLNTLFAHGPALALPSNKTTFYFKDPEKYGLSNAHKPITLPRGLELWRGFFQSIRATTGQLYWNLDTTTGAFIQSGSLPEFVFRWLGGKRFSVLDARDLSRLNRLLRNTEITIDLGPSRPVKHSTIRVGITNKDPRVTTFPIGDAGEEISIEEYVKKNFGVHLRHPELPCVEIRKGVIYPMEFISIKPGNRYLKRLDQEQQLRATDFQTLKPGERIKAITAIAESDSLTRPYLPQFGVNALKGPSKVIGRVLAPPVIDYKASGTQNVNEGQWRMNKGRTKLAQPTVIKSYAIVSSVNPSKSGEIMQSIVDITRECDNLLGLRFPPPPKANVVVSHDPRYPAEETLTLAISKAGDAHGSKPDLVFWVFDSLTDPNYHLFKAFGLRTGMATQGINIKNCSQRKTKDYQFILNMAFKINSKNRGTNQYLDHRTTSGERRAGWFEENLRQGKRAMVFGADISHADGLPSIASIVGSMDDDAVAYADVSTAQNLIPPAHVGGIAKKQEIIVHLAEMMQKLLQAYYASNCGALPDSLLFFRDGGSESEWSKIVTHEVQAIKEAVSRFKDSVQETASDKDKGRISAYKPKVTMILCLKGHHIRAFGVDKDSMEGRSGNIPAGTVIERGAADARAFDWYSAAHTGILGTTRPTRYVVMTDEQEPKLTPDELQAMTNSLCHAYQRCQRAVSLPAPVYYADIVAGKMRGLMPDEHPGSDSATVTSDASRGATHHERESTVHIYTDFLAEIEAGHKKLRGGAGVPPSMWWL